MSGVQIPLPRPNQNEIRRKLPEKTDSTHRSGAKTSMRRNAARLMLQAWGKNEPLDRDNGPQWHPLAYHCLDAAAVMWVLLTNDRGYGDWLAQMLGVSRGESDRLICYLAALHDIGMFARKFLAKSPEHYPACFEDDPTQIANDYDHGAGGLRLFDSEPDAFMLPKNTHTRTWRPLISAVTGHHGTPPQSRRGDTMNILRATDFGHAGIEAAHEFMRETHKVLGTPKKMAALKLKDTRRASFALAGLVVIADWIGSNQKWFPYEKTGRKLESYWNNAKDRAKRAVSEAGVLPAAPSSKIDYEDLIGPKTTPSPMQKWAQKVDLPRGAALFVIEDETGSGKTESAMMLAHRLMVSKTANGVYIALPTMSTADAMFDRLAKTYRHLFASNEEPSIALAHGARDQHPGFRAAMARAKQDESIGSNTSPSNETSETTASATCVEWIADDRRLSFLADAGAGTIDQALLAVIPNRHQSLRLLGLMRRVLIISEAHAYDAFMQREVERLLEFHAGLGGSAIILSATLSLKMRKRLTDAFALGLGVEYEETEPRASYPMATIQSRDGISHTSITGLTGKKGTVPVRFLRAPSEALDEVTQAAREGKAVLYIRNTVDDALDAHANLESRGLDPLMFHARFALVDRLNIEREIGRTFGKGSSKKERKGKIVIATQVAEQSLDVDFDVVITDLAPIDILIQRAGKLWRHEHRQLGHAQIMSRSSQPIDETNDKWFNAISRQAEHTFRMFIQRARKLWRQKHRQRKGHPELVIVAPQATDNADDKWFSKMFPQGQHVYQDHADLWLSARILEETGYIESPGGIRTLIEAVYGDDRKIMIPHKLQIRRMQTHARTEAHRGIANYNVLDFTKGYTRDAGSWDKDLVTSAHLGDEPQVTLRLAHIVKGRLEPYALEAAPEEPWHTAWRLSEVNVSAERVNSEAVPKTHGRIAREGKSKWTQLDSEKLLVVLEHKINPANEKALTGMVWLSRGTTPKEVRIDYDRKHGLEFVDEANPGLVPSNASG